MLILNEIKLYKELELYIETLRRTLIETGIQKGLNHHETLKCSQILDELIVKQILISNQYILND